MSPNRVEASPNPDILRWGRLSAGLDLEIAAKKVLVKPERLEAWESGELRPTIGQLRKLSHAYRRSIAVFYLSEPPDWIDLPPDYRRLPGEVAGTESPDLRLELRKAMVRRDVAVELSEEGYPASLGIEIALDEDPELAGAKIRDWLDVSLEEQVSWRGPYDSFNGWRFALETVGTLVFQMTEVELSEARGFSIDVSPLPVIAVNIKDSPRGRVFSLLHECAHLALRRGGLCDMDDSTSRDEDLLRVEQFCNAVAGASLVPREEILNDEVVRSHDMSEQSWSSEETYEIARRFGVSEEVVIRRLLDLGLTSRSYYLARRQDLSRAYAEFRQQQSGGFAPPANMAFASNGPLFTGLVLSSYSDGTITGSDVSDYLGVRLKHLPKIRSLVLGSS